MRLLQLSFIFLATALVWISPAGAEGGQVVQCGKAIATNLPTEPQKNYCDIYARQMAYRKESMALSEKLEQRQENYAIPRNQAYHDYRDNLDQLNLKRGTDKASFSVDGPGDEDTLILE